MAKGRNSGLGRGLDALFADHALVDKAEQEKALETTNKAGNNDGKYNEIRYININDISPNEKQPRKVFDESKIKELSDSILEHGIIQPLVVRKHPRGFEIVAGERRWRAAKMAGLREIPCILREFSDSENMLVAIIENMQREDLNPIEEATGLNEMIRVYGMTQEEVSKSVSKSRPYITNALRLLKLPSEIQDLVSDGKITTGHARALINIDSKKLQADICRRIVEDGLSVREVEKLAAGEKKAQKTKKVKEKSNEILWVEDKLKSAYGTKVTIKEKGKKGSIEIEYYSKDELNRLVELLMNKGN